ncbi:MAG: tetraacyldisaccharide 4'-kinase [Fidelibacterota bacterium]|nr:MAG: tetraacyldisaccharide 4'-kinase [Candidatus Neomarinimicrobiota bacterium]
MPSLRTWTKLRPLLWPVSLLYWVVAWCRNFFYNIGFFITRRVSVPVVSIGNLSVGGTGKTPAVIFIAQHLLNLGYKVGVVSRGYGRRSSGTILVSDGKHILADSDNTGDEPYLIASQLTTVPVLVDEDRYRGAATMITRFEPDVIILDDAFQHRGLTRDCDIVLLDASSPLSDYHIFPNGVLREHFGALKRANLVVWTRVDSRSPIPELKQRVAKLGIPQIHSEMEVNQQLIESATGDMIPAEQLQGERILAFCGIAQPLSFYHALIKLGLEPETVRYYPDHYHYSNDDIMYLSGLTEENRLTVVTTEKDAVKLDRDFLIDCRVYALRIKFCLTGQNLKTFQETLLQYLPLPKIISAAGEA